jgi:hypothetical protein
MRIPLVVLAAALATLTGVPDAAASAPTRETVHASPRFVIGDCSGAAIEAAFQATRVITTWYDDEGNPVRRLVHAEIPGTVTNLDTGTTLQTTGVRNLQIDLVNGGSTSTGTNVHVVLPGEGTLQLVAGRVAVDAEGNVTESGRLDEDLPSELCAALI